LVHGKPSQVTGEYECMRVDTTSLLAERDLHNGVVTGTVGRTQNGGDSISPLKKLDDS
jgi:hypothetical protein